MTTASLKEPRSVSINTHEDPYLEYGLRLNDNSDKVDEMKFIMDYTNNLFTNINETTYVNENRPRLWFWKNVMFVISTGLIYNSLDKKVLDEILMYFNTEQQQFLPNKYIITDYHSDDVKVIERDYNIGSGNYHFMLVPVVVTDNEDLLKTAPENAYSRYGSMNPIINVDDIVLYMIEIMDKYGAIRSELPTSITSRMGIKEGTYGVKRDNHIEERINDQFDLNTVVNTTDRQWFDESVNGLNYRNKTRNHYRHVNGFEDSTSMNTSNSRLSSKSKYNLLNQISSHDPSQALGLIPQTKGVHMRYNDFYETLSHRDERCQYIINGTNGANVNEDSILDIEYRTDPNQLR